MPTTDDIILQRLLAAYRHGHRLVLVFDYDGTLTPLMAHRSMAPGLSLNLCVNTHSRGCF
ncbi:MAG: hypothetical protein IPK63_04440 [Candidatus Competibacteraceae bacterium]|nr:hypothetical protein [Candidatus Competibacteraceae bacterium]